MRKKFETYILLFSIVKREMETLKKGRHQFGNAELIIGAIQSINDTKTGTGVYIFTSIRFIHLKVCTVGTRGLVFDMYTWL